MIHTGRAAYHKNSLSGGCPALSGDGAYRHYPERVEGVKLRKRSESFADHYSQATLFWNSMSSWEKEHIVGAFRFELGKVDHRHIREGVVEHLNHVDHDLAVAVAEGIGVEAPAKAAVPNHGRSSPALSQQNAPRDTVESRKVAILVADGVDAEDVRTVRDALLVANAVPEVIAARDGSVRSVDGVVPVTRALTTVASVLYDAVVIPGGAESVRALEADGEAVRFVAEAFKHGKAIGAIGDGRRLLVTARLNDVHAEAAGIADQGGVVTQADPGGASEAFVEALSTAIAAHRHYDRDLASVPA
jgi:catalase